MPLHSHYLPIPYSWASYLSSLDSRMRTMKLSRRSCVKTSSTITGTENLINIHSVPLSLTGGSWLREMRYPSAKGRKGMCKQVQIWPLHLDVHVCSEETHVSTKWEKKSLSILHAGSKAVGIMHYLWSKQTQEETWQGWRRTETFSHLFLLKHSLDA